MKKYFNILTCAACAVALLSCQKEIEAPEIQEDGIIPSGYTLETLRGQSEATKTTVDNGITLWAENDQIKVICSDNSVSNFTIQDGVGTNTGDFTGLVPEGKTAVYAVYPAVNYSSVSGSTVKVSIPASQTGVFGAGNIAVAKVASDHSMAFKNVNTFISFTIPAEITKVVISSVSGADLAGTLSVACSGDAPAAGALENGASSVTTTFPDANGGTYYISVAPGVTHTKGLLLTYYKMVENEETESGTYYLNKTITTAANSNIIMGTVEAEGNNYVTVSGAGNKNGMSWANAMSAEQMWKKLHLAGTDAATDEAKLAAIDGAVFHMGAGTYNFGETPEISFNETDAVTLTFKGGYNASTGARDPENNHTDFTAAAGYSALQLSGKMNITMDGIRITGNSVDGNKRAALESTGSGVAITLVDCEVSNNSNATDSEKAGAGIVLTGGTLTATGVTFSNNTAYTAPAIYNDHATLLMTECVFDRNVATNWCGAIRLRTSGSSSFECTFEECTFSNNSAVNDYGALQHSAGTCNLNNCTFTGNTAGAASDHKAGAVGLNGTGSVVVRGGTFSGNSACWGGAFFTTGSFIDVRDAVITGNTGRRGAAAYCLGTCNFTRCTVSENHADWGGAFHVSDANERNATLRIYGGTIQENYAKGGGAILSENGGNILIDLSRSAGTVFDGNYCTNNASGNGGAIRHESAGNISIVGATFRNNHMDYTRNDDSGGGNIVYGGAVSIYDGQSDAQVTIDDCIFNGNYSAFGGGTAISYQSGSSGNKTGWMKVSNTTFTGNHTDYTGSNNANYGRHGGAIRLGHDTTPSYFDNCSFIGNYTLASNSEVKSAYGGAVTFYADGNSYFNNCHFENNHATRGGAISAWGCTASGIYMNGCSFSGNWISYYYGTTIYVEKTKYFCMNNCSIADNTYTLWDAEDAGCWVYVNGDSSARATEECVISNCSFMGSCRKTSSLSAMSGQELLWVRYMKSGKYCYLINNAIIAGDNQNSWWISNANTMGYNNVYTKKGETSSTYTPSNDTSGKAVSNFGNLSWDSTDNVWVWNGTLAGGYSGISASTFTTQVNAGSSAFKAWLDEIGATNKDQVGNNRGSSSWWPGAYQDSQGSNGLLKVITWNICSDPNDNITDHSWNARRGGMAAFINDRLPHIVCMQECEPDPRSYLTSNCSGYSAVYDNTSLSWTDQHILGKENSYNVILYKSSDISVQSSGTFWLTSGAPTTPTIAANQNSYRSCTWMKCTYQGQKMLVLDTHLSYRTKNNSEVNSDDVIALRQTEMGVIKTWINGHYNPSNDGWLLFMGDMNASHYEAIFDEWKDGTYGYFSREGFTGGATGRTYNDWDWEFGNVSTIDFQFYKGFPSVKSYTIPTATYSNVAYLSDHWPVVVEYRMN
ncbi:MAG: hypothetical protein IKP46_03310 [Bacteroidales bacterium]|nr:hypothetical protein [Bacteroidales bacterium]